MEPPIEDLGALIRTSKINPFAVLAAVAEGLVTRGDWGVDPFMFDGEPMNSLQLRYLRAQRAISYGESGPPSIEPYGWELLDRVTKGGFL